MGGDSSVVVLEINFTFTNVNGSNVGSVHLVIPRVIVLRHRPLHLFPKYHHILLLQRRTAHILKKKQRVERMHFSFLVMEHLLGSLMGLVDGPIMV